MDQNSNYLPDPKGYSTTAIHSEPRPEEWDSMCIIPPLVLSTTFKQDGPNDFKKYEYGRCGNPSRDVLQNSLAKLENAKHAYCFSCGLGALTGLVSILTTGDHIICTDDLFGGNFRLLDNLTKNFGMSMTLVDTTDVDTIEPALQENTKMIFVESPTNPMLKVSDLAAIAKIAKKHKLIFAVDNTFSTSYLQRPLDLGADISLYSLTKFTNGHTDVIMGAIVTNDDDIAKKLYFVQNGMGIIPSPFDCFLVSRSLKTLALRMQRHRSNSLAVAEYLEGHPNVLKVLHPGLKSHPQHELSKRQTSGHGGMVCFYVKGGIKESEKFLRAIRIFTLASSLGGSESLAELPYLMTHASIPEAQRKALGITDNFIRLSVGLEDPQDLVADLKQALDSL